MCRRDFEPLVLPGAPGELGDAAPSVSRCAAQGAEHSSAPHAAVIPSPAPLTFSEEVDDGNHHNGQQDARDQGHQYVEYFMSVERQQMGSESPFGDTHRGVVGSVVLTFTTPREV